MAGSSQSSAPGLGGKGGGATVTPNAPPVSTAPVSTAPGYTPASPFQYAGAMQPPGGQNVFNTSANLFNQAAQGPNIGQFMNPYTSEVIGRTGMDMARQASMQQNALGAQATAAGAFGGSRHGVAEGTMLGDYGRAFGDMAAGQRQQGFNTALGAAQNQQGITSGLAGQGFGMGQAIGQQQWQQGSAQQATNQALIDAVRNQYAGFTGSPLQALQTQMAGVQGANMGQQTQTSKTNPGMLGILGGLMSVL